MDVRKTNANQNQRQPLSMANMYSRNAGAFFDGTNECARKAAKPCCDSDSCPFFLLSIPTLILGYSSLLFTMTIGAGIKTLIDNQVREPLLLSDVDDMIEALEYLVTENDCNKIDELSSSISSFQGGSGSQRKLQTALVTLERERQEIIANFYSEEKKKLIDSIKKEEERILTECIKENNITFFKTIYTGTRHKLSKDLEIQITQSISDKVLEINDKARKIKVRHIMHYLTAAHNAGKKLQHHIFEQLKPVIDERKSVKSASMVI